MCCRSVSRGTQKLPAPRRIGLKKKKKNKKTKQNTKKKISAPPPHIDLEGWEQKDSRDKGNEARDTFT
jgi:hypothetical protein